MIRAERQGPSGYLASQSSFRRKAPSVHRFALVTNVAASQIWKAELVAHESPSDVRPYPRVR